MLGYESDEKMQIMPYRGAMSASGSQTKLKGMGRNSMGEIVPISENPHNIRAMHELEMIKKFNREKELEQ